MEDFKKFLQDKNVQVIYVENMLLSFKWDTDSEDNAEIKNQISAFLTENNLKDGTRLTGTCNVNIMNKNVDLSVFEPITEEEYMQKYWGL